MWMACSHIGVAMLAGHSFPGVVELDALLAWSLTSQATELKQVEAKPTANAATGGDDTPSGCCYPALGWRVLRIGIRARQVVTYR
jgi:hypothetical protein